MFILLLFIVLCSTLFLSFFEREGTIKYKWTYIVITIMLCAMAAFRPEDVVRDYSTYIEHFSSKIKSEIEVEPSFQMIASAIKYFTNSYIWLFIVYALLSIPLFSYALQKLSLHPHLSLSIWIANFFILQNLTQIRVAVSIAFFLWGLFFVLQKQKIRYLLCIVCASFFHYSAIVLLLGVLFSNRPIKKYERYILLSLPIISFVFSIGYIDIIDFIPIPYIQERIRQYNSLSSFETESINFFNIPYLLHLATYFLLLIKYQFLTAKISYLPLIIRIYACTIFFYLSLSFLPVLSTRISELFGIIEVLMIPSVSYAFLPQRYGILIVCIYAIAIFLFNVFYMQLLMF